MMKVAVIPPWGTHPPDSQLTVAASSAEGPRWSEGLRLPHRPLSSITDERAGCWERGLICQANALETSGARW